MRKLALFFLLFLISTAFAADETPSKPSKWYLDDIARLAAGSGRWITDNSAYNSENEAFEAYGTEWISGFDGATMTGRLFGISDGIETQFNFWEFRHYWHPGRKVAVVEQFGWGSAIGIGDLVEDGSGTKSDQVFFNADGSITRTGHKSVFADADNYVTKSFDIVDGEWKPRRTYACKRQPADKQ